MKRRDQIVSHRSSFLCDPGPMDPSHLRPVSLKPVGFSNLVIRVNAANA